eukprot:scaffold2888_cov274-Pinguiococcus_pyrenoidosus.AAC.7
MLPLACQRNTQKGSVYMRPILSDDSYCAITQASQGAANEVQLQLMRSRRRHRRLASSAESAVDFPRLWPAVLQLASRLQL